MTRASPLKWIRTGVFGMPQDAFAEIVGVSRLQVSRYERGENAPPYDYLARVRLAGRLRRSDFSADWLFEIPAPHADETETIATVSLAPHLAPSGANS